MADQGTDNRVPPAVEGIQVNFCKNPQCANYGVPASIGRQPRTPGSAAKRMDAYVVTMGHKTPVPLLKCKHCNEQPAMKNNLGIHEETCRFWVYLVPEEQMVCPNESCQNHLPMAVGVRSLFSQFGKTQSGSQRYRCKACGVTFSVGSPTNHQKAPHKNLTVFRLLVNKMPFRRICEVADINQETLYRKIDFIHQQCMLFAGNRERVLPEKRIRRLYIGVDRQDYLVNWASSMDRRNVMLHAVAAADNGTGYVFATHLNFDPSLSHEEIEQRVRAINDGSKEPPFRRYARLWIEDDYSEALRTSRGNYQNEVNGPRSLMGDIALMYEEVENRADTEISETPNENIKLPSTGVQVHAEYTLYGHFFFLRKLLDNVEKIRFFLDQDSGIRAACLSAFCDRIKESRCDAFYVRIKTDITIDEKRRILADSRARFQAKKALHPDLSDSQVKLLIIKERLNELTAIGKWKDRWVEHPFPNMGEPEKVMCYLTDMHQYDEDHVAWLYNKASKHAVDRFFMQARRRMSLLERPLSTMRNRGRRWHGYGPYNPAMIGKLLDIFRVFYNYVEAGQDKQTPAMRVGLVKSVASIEDILYYGK